MDFASDGQTYLRACGGDRVAVRSLVERHNPSLLAVARAMGLADHDAMDVVQFAWMRFFEHVKGVGAGTRTALRQPESVRFWLFTTCRNAARDLHRRRKRSLELVERATGSDEALGLWVDEDDPAEGLIAEEVRGSVGRAVARLSEECRDLIGLLMLDPPPSYEEIAVVLGRPVGSIGPIRGRCLTRLRELLDKVER